MLSIIFHHVVGILSSFFCVLISIFVFYFEKFCAHFSLLQHGFSHVLDVLGKKCVLEKTKRAAVNAGAAGPGVRRVRAEGRSLVLCLLFRLALVVAGYAPRGREGASLPSRRSPMGTGSWLPPRACGLHGAVHASTRPYVGRSVRVRIRVCTGLFFIVVGVYAARTT